MIIQWASLRLTWASLRLTSRREDGATPVPIPRATSMSFCLTATGAGMSASAGSSSPSVRTSPPSSKKRSARPASRHPLHDKKGRITGQWAEVCFVPNAECTTKKGEPYRYLAIREQLKQPHLPDMLPFQTIAFDDTQYKLFAVVTNMDWEEKH